MPTSWSYPELKIASRELTDAGPLVTGHDAAGWTDVALEIRIDASVTVTDCGVRSTHRCNVQYPTAYSVIIIIIIIIII